MGKNVRDAMTSNPAASNRRRWCRSRAVDEVRRRRLVADRRRRSTRRDGDGSRHRDPRRRGRGRDPQSTTVGEIASRDLVTVDPEQDLDDALRLMLSTKFAGCPSRKKTGVSVGILAQADVAREGKDAKRQGQVVQKSRSRRRHMFEDDLGVDELGTRNRRAARRRRGRHAPLDKHARSTTARVAAGSRPQGRPRNRPQDHGEAHSRPQAARKTARRTTFRKTTTRSTTASRRAAGSQGRPRNRPQDHDEAHSSTRRRPQDRRSPDHHQKRRRAARPRGAQPAGAGGRAPPARPRPGAQQHAPAAARPPLADHLQKNDARAQHDRAPRPGGRPREAAAQPPARQRRGAQQHAPAAARPPLAGHLQKNDDAQHDCEAACQPARRRPRNRPQDNGETSTGRRGRPPLGLPPPAPRGAPRAASNLVKPGRQGGPVCLGSGDACCPGPAASPAASVLLQRRDVLLRRLRR